MAATRTRPLGRKPVTVTGVVAGMRTAEQSARNVEWMTNAVPREAWDALAEVELARD